MNVESTFMKCRHAQFKKLLLSCVLIGTPAWADPVWHCSRSDVQIADASNDFTLAALNIEREVIRLSLRDLYDVYQGTPIKLSGGLQLSACIVGNNSKLTATAMNSIGAKPGPAIKGALYFIEDESAMLACITKNHPAIGYLSEATHTEAVGPCF